MSRSNGNAKPRRHFLAEEKATILRRHLADKVPISDLCEEYHIQSSRGQALEHLAAALQDGRGARYCRCHRP
jgi:hypothetical protein